MNAAPLAGIVWKTSEAPANRKGVIRPGGSFTRLSIDARYDFDDEAAVDLPRVRVCVGNKMTGGVISGSAVEI